MKNVLIIGLVLILYSQSFAQQPIKDFSKWDNFIGIWESEGEGKPGQGGGTFSFQYDLERNIIIRKNHSEYPATKDKPAIVHDDLLIIYFEQDGTLGKAIYFDNEGHVINYSIAFPSDKSILFVSESIPGKQRFKLIYLLTGRSNMDVSFEIAPPGKPDAFSVYVSGKAHKRE